MRALVQRVTRADVQVDGETIGKIGGGLLVFIGAGKNDTDEDCEKLAQKLAKLRIFSDSEGKTNLSVNDVGGDMLVISQFTLYADCSHGNRPSFVNAGAPDEAERLYEYFKLCCAKEIGGRVECGSFGADMKVSLCNDGPFTVMLRCENGKIF